MIPQVGDIFQGIKNSGCSTFFITSSLLSIYNGKKSRQNSWENAIQDEKFQTELQKQKEQYEDFKEAEERAFKLWLKQKQREFVRKEATKKLEYELLKTELQMFFKDWPLKISIEAINEKRVKLSEQTKAAPINIIIGKHNIGPAKDALSQSYPMMIDEVKSSLKNLNILETNIYRFKDITTVNGGPALANIFAMMNCMPTIVILPSFNGKTNQFSISVGCWNQDSLFPMQRKIFTIYLDEIHLNNNNEYKSQKMNEIKHAYVTVASVLNDTYSLLEERISPSYPSYAKENSIAADYPYLLDFANKEYMSLMNDAKSVEDLCGTLNSKFIDSNLSNSINALH